MQERKHQDKRQEDYVGAKTCRALCLDIYPKISEEPLKNVCRLLIRFVFQEDHAVCREGHILEVDKTKGNEPIGDDCNIQVRKMGVWKITVVMRMERSGQNLEIIWRQNWLHLAMD